MEPRDRTNPEAVKAFHERILRNARQTAHASQLRVEELTQRYSETAGAQPGNEAPIRVLLVEDNPDQAESMAMVLCLWGFQPAIAADGPTALEIASREPPDVVLADIGLPGGMDGFELAQKLHERPELRDVPIAAVTAYTDEKSRQRSRDVGLVKHFGKPADLAALHRLLDDRRDQVMRQRAEAVGGRS
jgi:CheY-like chemotaxis protein